MIEGNLEIRGHVLVFEKDDSDLDLFLQYFIRGSTSNLQFRPITIR